MPRGTRDWVSTTRPYYGIAQRESFNDAVTANDTTTLITVTAKGMIYGGSVFLDTGAGQSGDIVELWIDGVQKTFLSFGYLLAREFYSPDAGYLYLDIYDGEKNIYCVYLTKGTLFEESFVIKYKEIHGNTPTVVAELHYATI